MQKMPNLNVDPSGCLSNPLSLTARIRHSRNKWQEESKHQLGALKNLWGVLANCRPLI
jgi:hypothetical protein